MTLPVASATEAPSIRSVTEPTMLPAESTTRPVVSLRVPMMLPAESTTVPVGVSSVPTMWPAESTTTEPSTGAASAASAASGAAPAASVAASSAGWASGCAVGRSRVGRRRVGAAGDSVGLVDRAVLEAGRDRVRIHVLGDHDTLVGQRLRGGSVGEDVGRHGPGDRRHDVGVQSDGEVDGCSPIDREVDVRGEVEDRDDFLVRERGHPLGGQLLGRQRCELVGTHRVSLLAPGTSCRGLPRPVLPVLGPPPVLAIGPSGPPSPMPS